MARKLWLTAVVPVAVWTVGILLHRALPQHSRLEEDTFDWSGIPNVDHLSCRAGVLVVVEAWEINTSGPHSRRNRRCA
jgi:hypothetical protein